MKIDAVKNLAVQTQAPKSGQVKQVKKEDMADLYILSARPTHHPGLNDMVYYNVYVGNAGTKASNYCAVEMDAAGRIITSYLPGLSPGAVYPLLMGPFHTFPYHNCYNVRFHVDPYNQVPESNKGNNYYTDFFCT